MKTTGRRSMQAAGLFWSSIITIRSWAGSLLHGDRFGLTLRAHRLHKSRDTIEYFGSSIANGSMAEDGTKIPRSRSPEAGCWSTNLNLHGEYGPYSGPRRAKGREPKDQSRKPHQYFLRGSMSALSFPKLPGDVKD